MSEYAVFKQYHYSEIYYVNAVSERAAIEMLDDIEFGQEPDNIIKEFDHYDASKVKTLNNMDTDRKD